MIGMIDKYLKDNNINGKRKRKGIVYHFEGLFLQFEGEYLNDLKWNGIGNEILINIRYEIIDGNVLIKEIIYINELVFEGEYIN